MSLLIRLFKAVFTRSLFVIHVISTLKKVEEVYGIRPDYFVPFCLGMLLLAVETMYTLVRRKGKEYK